MLPWSWHDVKIFQIIKKFSKSSWGEMRNFLISAFTNSTLTFFLRNCQNLGSNKWICSFLKQVSCGTVRSKWKFYTSKQWERVWRVFRKTKAGVLYDTQTGYGYENCSLFHFSVLLTNFLYPVTRMYLNQMRNSISNSS